MNVAGLALRYEKLIVFAVGALSILGIAAYVSVPASIFPNMSFARVDVVATAGDLPPDQVRVGVTLPLERAFQALPSVTRVLATSTQGSGEVVIEFDPKSDVQTDLQHVNDAINQVRADLPASSTVVSNVINPNSEPVVSYAFVSQTMSQTLLRELIEQSVVPQFYGTPGLGRILVAGGPQREFHVTLDPAALAAHGIPAQSVADAIADANTISALGVRPEYYQANVLLLDAGVKDASALRAISVPDAQKNPIPLQELGSVGVGVAPLQNQVSVNAQHAVMFNAYALAGADAVKMGDAIEARFDALERHLPEGVTVAKFWDQTELVKESQASLRDAILLGALLAVLVIYAFLRNLRMTLIAAIVIPIAMSITIFVMQRVGLTLNLMSVGGLAVAVGLIIDDAIVVIENIARNLREHRALSKRETIVLSMRQLGAPMAASTFTTVVVFVPLALLSGVSGFFFRALAFTLSASLLVSLALALFVTPLIANRLIHSAAEAHDRAGFIDRVLARYDPLLQWALHNRRTVYAISGGILLVTVVLLRALPSDFLPKLDEGQFEITYRMPVGTTLSASDAAATAMERIVMEDPAVRSVGRLTGIDTNGYSPTPQSGGLMRVKLKSAGVRDGYEAVADRLRERLSIAVPAAQLDFHQILEDMIDDLSGAPAPLEIDVRGADQATLVATASTIADRLSDERGVTDVFNGVIYDDPTIRVAPVGPQLAALGLTSADLSSALAATTQGTIATSVPGVNTLVPVRVRVAGDSSSPASATLVTPAGAVALADVARVRRAGLSTDIDEENGQRVVRVVANSTGVSLSGAVASIRSVLRRTPLPPGYTATIGGQYRTQQQSFREFVVVIAIAVALVFAVMLGTFHSYRLPLVILTAIPLALIGVALGLFLTRTPFNVSSFMGLLLLVGIVVKNGILLIDVANQRRLAGDDVTVALRVAGRTRLRPIVMTTFAAIGGLLPLALGLGSGAEMERPLAIAVIGGLSTATLFTLIVIPVLYAGFAGSVRVGEDA
ncbi:MAG: efflux RND transporter permease subunit [Candidatus Eremiobacteraeota bacterium]|nr:efflux RND transporter permease subunit [Candidatus Eremiobacteraeota bacterium]